MVSRLLLRKARRDLVRNRGPFIALVLMTSLGVATLTAVYGSYSNLDDEVQRTYRDQAFHDLRVTFNPREPATLSVLGGVQGVAAWESRLSADLPATFAKSSDAVIAHAISIPDTSLPSIDALRFRDGLRPEPHSGQVALEYGFARHHDLHVGDDITLRGLRGTQRFTVTGTVTSPEYLYPAKTAVEHMPDTLRRWGVVYVPQSDLEELANATRSVNEATFRLDAGAKPLDVYDGVAAALGRTQVTQVETRQTQASSAVLDSMVGFLATLALILPLLFLVVVSLSTYVLLTRLVASQRANIGLLRAMGYEPRAVLLHYLTFAPIVAIAGAVLGFVAGWGLNYFVTPMFGDIVKLVDVPIKFRPTLLLVGLALSLAFCVLAAILPARAASRLQPAEAMRPPAPKWNRRPWLEHFLGRRSGVAPGARLGVRNSLRNPRRGLLTMLGLSLSVALVIAPFGLVDAVATTTDRSLRDVQRFNDLAVFTKPVPRAAVAAIAASPLIHAATPMLQLQRSVIKDEQALGITIFGVPAQTDLLALRSADGRQHRVQPDAVLLSRVFEREGYHVGDRFTIGATDFRIDAFVRAAGLSVFMPIETAQRLAGLPDVATSVAIAYEPWANATAGREYAAQRLPVAAFQSLESMVEDVQAMMAIINGFVYLLVSFGAIIAVAIVFNTVAINVLEEARDFATMRTIGIPMRRIAAIINVETGLLAVPGILLGLLFGYVLANRLVGALKTQSVFIELSISNQTYLIGVAVGVTVVLLSQLPPIRSVSRFDLAKSVRERST